MNSEKLARRKKMGDDPTAVQQSNMTMAGAIPAQPLPNAPQDGRSGNMMNNPMNGDSQGGGLASSGSLSGQNMFPYNDSGLDPGDPRMGAIGFQQPSGMNQNMVPGQRLNKEAYNSVMQPDGKEQRNMLPNELANTSIKFAEKMYGDAFNTPYEIGGMGMMGQRMEAAQAMAPTPGNFPFNTPQQSQNMIPLQGLGDVEGYVNRQSGGMSMATGNRNENLG